jgi:hypothetical protein
MFNKCKFNNTIKKQTNQGKTPWFICLQIKYTIKKSLPYIILLKQLKYDKILKVKKEIGEIYVRI